MKKKNNKMVTFTKKSVFGNYNLFFTSFASIVFFLKKRITQQICIQDSCKKLIKIRENIDKFCKDILRVSAFHIFLNTKFPDLFF